MKPNSPALKAPFPAFGGKSRVAHLVWPRLGNPRNFIEPFCFSLAMLLLRPDEPQIETVNDLNPFVSNFWRAIQRDPEAVAYWADWPVNETDLHARHKWLVYSRKARASLARVKADPDYFDAKIAGWWCWGACMWIGSGWCETQQLPHMSNAGQGVNALTQQLPHMDPTRGVLGERPDAETTARNGATKHPQLCNGNTTHGVGVHGEVKDAPNVRQPALGQFGWGVNANRNAHRPQLADAYSHGRGVHGNDALTDCHRRRLWLIDWFVRLADRLRPVRVCCGHWARVCDSESTLTRLGITGVFLDPPYALDIERMLKWFACLMGTGPEPDAKGAATNRAGHIYANDKSQDVDYLVAEVAAWCLKWGGDRSIRIAVCGLEGEYPMLDEARWDKVAWKSRGGYGNRTDRGKENAARERIWFSPFCIKPAKDHDLFGFAAAGGEVRRG
jgi:hypothetical protein